MFKEAFVLDGKQIKDRQALAQYLINNFKKSVNFISDNSLYSQLERELPEIYQQTIELSKDFEHKENILTLIIYLLDNNVGIKTPNHIFSDNYAIADVMKRCYPSIDKDIKVLFHDKVLAHIFWNEFAKTNDSRYKRNYTFMLHVYENRMYDFTYYYYLFLHLSKNEVVRFSLDGVKMKTLAEITVHVSNNFDRSQYIIEEILHNPFIIAKMAIESGIDTVASMLQSKRTLEILKLLSTYATVDLSPIIRRKMCYWLMMNYTNYTYETEEAKQLYLDYQTLHKTLTLSTLADYIAIYDEVEGLYKRFVSLFSHNKLIEYKKGISCVDEYYLNYRFNDEYVCKKFLTENNLYDETIHTPIHQDSVEREILVNALEEEKRNIIDFREEVLTLTKDLSFDKKKLNSRLFISIMYLLLVIGSFVCKFFLGFNHLNNIDQMVTYTVIIVMGLSCVFLLESIFRHSKKLKNAELVELAIDNSLYSIETINKEIGAILNPKNKSFNDSTLYSIESFSKNRKKDLAKIEKISKEKTTVSSAFLIIASTMAMIGIIEYGSQLFLLLFDFTPLVFNLSFGDITIGLNLLSLAIPALHLILAIIFRKHRFVYYLVYFYLVVLLVLSVILFKF